MYAPSLVSDSLSGNTSSSKLAKSPPLFSAWKFRARVVEILNPPANITAHFDNFYKLEEVPSTLIQGTLPMPTYNTEADFQRAVREWALALRPTDEDEYGILGVLPTLALAYNRIRKTSNNQFKEHSQRRGIDDIIEIAFSESIGRHCDFKIEQSYRVVELDDNSDAQSDTLVTIPSNKITDKLRQGRLFFANPNTMDNLCWSTNGVGDWHFSIIGFAGEFKKDDMAHNKNQLIMVLTTAQLQRKALSLKDSILIGATSCYEQVQFHSSFWNNDGSILQIYTHDREFRLTNPVDVVRLYIFCSKLEKYFQDNLASELQEWNVPDEETVKNFTWARSSTRKRTRAGTPSPARTRRRIDAGGGNDGPADADGFDNDRFMEVTKWRNEVNIEDRKETISGESEIPSMPGCDSKVEMSRPFGNNTSGDVSCKVSKDWVTSPERPSSPSSNSKTNTDSLSH